MGSKEASRRWRERHLEQHRADNKRYYEANKEKIRIAQMEWRALNPEKHLAVSRAAAKKWREGNSEMVRDSKKQYFENHPERSIASRAIKNAVNQGKLCPQPCFICGRKGHAHHASYAPDMWLCVTWLCASHHKQLHVQFNQSIEE
jgi:hypothetical protein